jgi:hypothetical protein
MNIFKPTFAILAVAAIAVGLGFASKSAPRKASLEGSYILEYRLLPDGKRLESSEVIGMMTYTKDRRNMNVYWSEGGKATSISVIASYSLSETEYTEKDIYFAKNDAGSGIVYDLSGKSGKSPVVAKDGKLSMLLPLHGEPSMSIEPNGDLVASEAGVFSDHWKKVR